MSNPIIVRKMRDTDRNFVCSAWLKNYKNSSEFAKRITHNVFFQRHNLIVNQILGRPRTEVLIAALKDEPDVVLGFLVYNSFPDVTIHYCFVKEDWRKIGIGRQLFDELKLLDSPGAKPVFFTHWTAPMDSIFNKLKNFNLTYDPYRI